MPNLKAGRYYKINNWSEYNRALVQRGSITIWIENGAIDQWFSDQKTGKPGRTQIYSDIAILTLLVVREVFHLPLRALQGFVQSIFVLMGLSLRIPSYSQISRRASVLGRRIKRLMKTGARDLVFDSSGLKVYGEGEWKVKTHGKGKRRTWRKLHLGINPATQEIVIFDLTSSSEGDAPVAKRMLKQIKGPIKRVYGDGAYDSSSFREAILERGADGIIPPPKNATYKRAVDGWKRCRDEVLAEIEGLGGGDEGRRLWKKLKRYHRRSLGETAFFRLKRLLGWSIKARSAKAQLSEAWSKCLAINTMTNLGMPRGRWIEGVI